MAAVATLGIHMSHFLLAQRHFSTLPPYETKTMSHIDCTTLSSIQIILKLAESLSTNFRGKWQENTGRQGRVQVTHLQAENPTASVTETVRQCS